MKFRVITTTDKKHIGAIFDVPDLAPATVLAAAGMRVEQIIHDGDLVHLVNSNYRVTIKNEEE